MAHVPPHDVLATSYLTLNTSMLALVILIIGTTYAIKEINDNVFI
jgi:hypothetical protein